MPALVADFFSWMGVGLPAFLFVITLVVFIHELGHFLVARWCGVSVETFSIGFGREIVGFTDRKGTRWKISWLPLGGYVKFLGDADASSRPDRQQLQQARAREQARLETTSRNLASVAVAGAGSSVLQPVPNRGVSAFDPSEGMLHMKPLYQRALVAAAGPIA